MKEYEYYKSNHLPHINIKNHFIFITFRTYDSVDNYVKKINNQEIENRKKQYKIDKYLDNSPKGAYLNGDIINIMRSVLFEKDGEDYILSSFSIMPNHIHLLMYCFKDTKYVIKNIKGKSAYLINKSLNRKGTFWMRDYYNKIIRDEKHFNTVVEYILNNPIKANLSDSEKRIYINLK